MKKHGIPMSHIARQVLYLNFLKICVSIFVLLLQWRTDSAAVSDWNVGRFPDSRALGCLRHHGIETAHKARQVEESIFSSLFIPMP